MTILLFLGVFVCYALFLYVRNLYRLAKHFPKLKTPELPIGKLHRTAAELGKKLPRIGIFVPARNEGYVIGNTVRSLAELDYPKGSYVVFTIVDERELKDRVEILTKDAAHRHSDTLNKKYGIDFLHVIEVPEWYGGVFGDKSPSYKQSTKGRALNFALQYLYDSTGFDDIEMIGILDADGRLDKNVLKEVAFNRLTENSKILQGPVFQVSNFKSVSTLCILAGLELAVHHMTDLTARLLSKKRKLKLLAGTNYFLDVKLLVEIGGWNCDSFVDDAELAVRIYDKMRIIPQWLSWPEVEQTTPSFSAYRKQRERWFRGNLELAKYVRKSSIPFWDKFAFIGKIYVGFIRIPLDISAMVAGYILLFSGVLRHLELKIQLGLLFWFIISMIIWDFYGFMYRRLACYIDPEMASYDKIVQSAKLFFFMPLFVLVQSIPKVSAVFKHIRGLNDSWYKTERSKEAVVE